MPGEEPRTAVAMAPSLDERAAGAARVVAHAPALLRVLCRCSVPTILEHLVNSRIWHASELLEAIRVFGGHTRVFDQCQFGRSWRKRTKLACFFIDKADTVKLDRRCKGSA
eukprot:2761141-Pyramimonas_sp.AAC.1